MDGASSTVQLAIVAGVFGAVNAVIAAVVVWINTAQTARIAKEAREDARMQRSAEILAATKIKEVKETLETTTAATDQKLERIESTGNEVRRNTNHALGIQYEMVASLREEKASRTKDPADIANAASARKIYDDHMKSQEPPSPMPVTIVTAEPVPVTVIDPPVVDAAAGKKA